MPAVNGRKESRCYVVSKEEKEQIYHDRARDFSKELERANANKKPCQACDALDNDWLPRRGLCLDCFCAVCNHLPVTEPTELFARMPRLEIIIIAMYYRRVEEEKHRQQARQGKLNVETPRLSGYKEVEKILDQYRS